MKKRCIYMVFIVLILVLILFLPIPTGILDDGGSREYAALMYKVVMWNKIVPVHNADGEIERIDTYNKMSFYWFPNNFKSIDELWKTESEGEDIMGNVVENDWQPEPTAASTQELTPAPTEVPTTEPEPTPMLTAAPTQELTLAPTEVPTTEPEPTPEPTVAPTPAPTAFPDITNCLPLSVSGTKLVDTNGNTVQLRGVSTHGLAWFPGYVNEAWFQQLKEEWGGNVVRLAMYTAEGGGYCTGGDKEKLKELIRNGVEYATNQGLYVIIDWHILSDGNPNTYLEEAKAFFGEMAEDYGDYTNVIYEICNEPNGGTSWQQVKEYAEAVISVIREKDSDGIILVGTPNWCQYVDQAATDPITGYENIMYTLHFYAATHTEGLRNNMVTALEAGLPLFVSEYGICDASGSGNIDEYQAGEWLKLMDEHQVSYVAWNLSNKAETSAFFKSSCSKTNGFTTDDLSTSGKWVYEMLRERAGKTVGSNLQQGETDAVPTGIPATPTESPVPPTNTPAPVGPELPQVQLPAGLTYTATMVNSWQQDGNTCAQYSVTLTNTADSTMETWNITIPFEEEFAVLSSWNGNFQVEGNVLNITPVDYNKSIQAGEAVSDIGFILRFTKN